MTIGIQKFRLEEKIRFSYFKHLGDVVAVADELELDLAFVKKICGKIKKKCDRDVNYFVASNITGYILMGFHQRTQYYREWLNYFRDKKKARISLCCKAPVREHEWDGETHYICLKCEKDCGTKIVDNLEIFDAEMRVLEELRIESEKLVEASDKMGYTLKEAPQVTKVTQYNIGLSGEMKEVASSVKDLRPTDRRKLITSIEKKLLKGKPEKEKSKKS